MCSSGLFTYGLLANESIRLLRLHNNPTPNYVGTLEDVKLDEAPSYYALSHCWGVRHQNVPIGIGDFTLDVTVDLAAGIQQLKKFVANESGMNTGVKYVWIDRICINQDDIEERESQVQLMGKIYSESIRTLIWLGIDRGTCSGAWPLIDRIYGVLKAEFPRTSCLADIPLALYSDQSHVVSGLPSWDSDSWVHLKTLLELPWFTRIWVVQEVALSSQDPLILHGEHIYQWDRLGWAASWLRRRGYIRLAQIPESIRNIDSMANIRRSHTRWSLDALLTDTSAKFHASDQRDKIYGLLGLATESLNAGGIPEPLRPDYKLSVEQVYQKVARYLLQQSRSLSILTRTSGGCNALIRRQYKHNLEHLPTWVPDWSDFAAIPRESSPSLSWIFYGDALKPAILGYPEHYAASARLPTKTVSISNESILRLGAIRVDTVIETISLSKGLPRQRFSQELASSIGLAWDRVVSFVQERGIPVLVEQFIHTTTADQHHLGGREPHQILEDGSAFLFNLLSRDKDRRLILTSQSGDHNAMDLLQHLSAGGDPVAYTTLAENYCFNRSFIITSGRCMGLGPIDTRPGDVVQIIYGGGVPYIVRQQEQGLGWLFIGESYFHGLMSGEMIKAQEQGEAREEILNLL
ncbi:HET domain-containing protein [Hypoxylon rubiginosum]|uniref:HET domain-containing protein n=1 Tax=Hypoxylon rubiginosum TaxID=110542 RepID=A0ACB9YXQ6_9PEZI|nr:HET domain-containing protein [Hypoxylon rubiginosum]